MDENVYVAPADGGPAFPVLSDYAPNGQLVAGGTYGMSLQDWFAGMALQGILSTGWGRENPVAAASLAYEHADAMMQARKEAPNA